MSLNSRSSALSDPVKDAQALASLADAELQAYLLDGVSRTFALTIPQLPESLRPVVSNAYLLCRIVDTIEDEPALTFAQKRRFCAQFAETVAGNADPQPLTDALAPLLSDRTLHAERMLVRLIPRVVGITRGFTAEQQRAIERCIDIMAEGMAQFQAEAGLAGLQDQPELDRYCYYVAGVVGEMLTELFCDYSPVIARERERLMSLAVSFGEGLQMTNILKDIWEDRSRGVCWLPRETFKGKGIELSELEREVYRGGFGEGLGLLIGIARSHLANALTYSLIIPPEETGIRKFCLWAVGMAVLTLRRINDRRDFRAGNEVKISRRSVKLTVTAVDLAAAHAPLVRLLFSLAAVGLPRDGGRYPRGMMRNTS